MRDVNIKIALNGYLVRVGCQRIVFNDREQMLDTLRDYLTTPDEIENLFLYNSLNSKQLGYVQHEQKSAGLIHAPEGNPHPYNAEED